MKGPWERIKYDGRRVWECPVCGHRDRALGQFTWRICRCQQARPIGERVLMKLVSEGFAPVKFVLPPGPE